MNKIGVMLNNLEKDRLKAFGVAKTTGFEVVHANTVRESWVTGPEGKLYIQEAKRSGLRIDSMFVGFDAQSYADIESVHKTVGILAVPEFREQRVKHVLAYSDFAKEIGVSSLGIHLGWIPSEKTTPEYTFLFESMLRILEKCEANGQSLNLETGQETPDHLLEFLQHINRKSLGGNFDCGNFLLYGTAEPIKAFTTLKPYVRGFHCKDGIRPSEQGKLGTEMPLGQGNVDFSTLLQNSVRSGYTGPFIIEREHGPNVIEEVQAGREYLQRILDSIFAGE